MNESHGNSFTAITGNENLAPNTKLAVYNEAARSIANNLKDLHKIALNTGAAHTLALSIPGAKFDADKEIWREVRSRANRMLKGHANHVKKMEYLEFPIEYEWQGVVSTCSLFGFVVVHRGARCCSSHCCCSCRTRTGRTESTLPAKDTKRWLKLSRPPCALCCNRDIELKSDYCTAVSRTLLGTLNNSLFILFHIYGVSSIGATSKHPLLLAWFLEEGNHLLSR